jgi:hypothetical protein
VGGGASKQASKQQVVSSIPFHHDHAQYSHSFIHSFIHINPCQLFDCKRKTQTNSKALLMKTTKWTNGKQKGSLALNNNQ